MSTLTTRMAGYQFTIRTCADGSVEGAFVNDTPALELPYELRSTYSNRDGCTVGILCAAVDAAESYLEWVAIERDRKRLAEVRAIEDEKSFGRRL